jgi:dihydroflavonol-4-reductase
VRRVVHTSTAGTCGPVRGRQATEDDGPPDWELVVPYKRTKLVAERLALEAGAVVVNPTTPVGDGDRKPTPTGQMIEGVARGSLRGFVATTGLNLVDVRDVARGHALALEHGAAGERYLLGGVDLPLEELFAAIADLAGRPRPSIRVPYAVALAASKAGIVNADEVRLARLPMYFSWEKARSRLGYEPGPVEPALARAVAAALTTNGGGGA